MSTSKPIGLETFTCLNPSIYIYKAPTTTPESTDPSLILLFTWMNASPRHISKYANGYISHYPNSTILIIRTSALDTTWNSHAQNIKRIAPVLEIIHSLPTASTLLLHLFSNGGAFTSCLLAEEYSLRTGNALPITKLILDSSPGRLKAVASVRAFAVSLPKNFTLRWIGLILLYVFYGMLRLQYMITRNVDIIERLRRALFDDKLFGERERLYIYSVGDEMVEWNDVEEHAAEAEKRGFGVKVEKYPGSGHCQHLMYDPERYWDAVQKLWRSY
ncbi:hypothetical protein B7494_g4105 [Chlorociboria aeruginascens]|nr:hypothetical protein B7494_g4105 [Chlorociboria aeruginascens]